MSVKQSTLNDHVNLEAVRAFAEQLRSNAARITDYGWLDGPTEKQANAISALVRAAIDLDVACTGAQEASQLASEVHYDRLYGRDQCSH